MLNFGCALILKIQKLLNYRQKLWRFVPHTEIERLHIMSTIHQSDR